MIKIPGKKLSNIDFYVSQKWGKCARLKLLYKHSVKIMIGERIQHEKSKFRMVLRLLFKDFISLYLLT